MEPDDYERIGVYDPGAPDAAARLDLLAHLTGAGVTPEQLAHAEQQGDLLAALPDVRLHGRGPKVSVAEIAARTALDPAFVARIWEAAGFAPADADAARFTESDVAAFGELAQVADLVGDEVAERFVAALGAAAATAAERSVAELVTPIETPVSGHSHSDAIAAEALDTTLAVLSSVADVFDVLFRHHAYEALTAYLRSTASTATESG